MLQRIKDLKHKKIIGIILFIAFLGFSYNANILQFHSDRATYDYNALLSKFNHKTEKKEKITEQETKIKTKETSNEIKKDDSLDGVLSSAANSVTDNLSKAIDVVEDIEILEDKIITLDYDFYTVNYNCDKGSFNFINYNPTSRYTLTKEAKDITVNRHILEKRVVFECKYGKEKIIKLSKNSEYKNDKFTRGYGIPLNLLEHNSKKEFNLHNITNVVPLHKEQNKAGGFWFYTDQLIGCLQNHNNIQVYTGNIWKDSYEDSDTFKDEFGISIPESLYKIIVVNNEYVYSWKINNDKFANARNEREHIISINEIEDIIDYNFNNIPAKLKNIKPRESLGLKNTCK